ncbi:acyl-CoA carboxylase subunit beta [Chloroflexota bacterium]
MTWQREINELERRQEVQKQMGGTEGIARQRSRGKLTVRERIDLLLDPNSFQEIGSIAGTPEYDETGKLKSFEPDVNVMGFGKINGRLVCINGQDFTIHGGANPSAMPGKKGFMEMLALDWRIPLIRLLDSGGTRVGTLDPRGRTFIPTGPKGASTSSLLSQVPVVSAVMGTCAGWVAVAAVQTHWNIMTRNTGELFVAGPTLVERALNTSITKQELGGYEVHTHSGVIDNVGEDEADACQQIRRFLGYLPQNVWQQPPRSETGDDPNRRDEELLSIIPREPEKTFDIRRLINHVIDKDSAFELSPFYGKSLVTLLARMDGYPVALMSNDSRHIGGAQDAAACEKMTRFIDFADTFHLPIIYLVDMPGFMIGPDSERQGTIRKAARILYAKDQSTTPWLSIIIRRCYGVAGLMHSHIEHQHLRFAWPSGQWGSLPVAGGAQAAYRKEIESAPDPEAKRLEIEKILSQVNSPFRTAEVFEIEEIIDPRDTRPLLCQLVRMSQDITATQLGPKSRIGIRP